MADIHGFSERVIDLAERLDAVADAANGKGIRKGGMGTRWLLLPAVGAGLYALATNGALTRRAKDVMGQAKTSASDLSDDLLGRVRQTSQPPASRSGSRSRSRSSSARKTGSSRTRSSRKTRKTSSAR
jgi:hypothetical protein